MINQDYIIKNETGLHTRPANRFIKTAKQFDCNITLKKGEKEANAKSMVKVMKMGIVKGDTIATTCDGEDEQEAMAGIIELLNSLEE